VAADRHSQLHSELRLAGLVKDVAGADGVVLQVRNLIVARVFDRDWLRQRSANTDLTDAMVRWKDGERQDDLLLRGGALDTALAHSAGRDSEPDEAEFLRASQALRQREETERRTQAESRSRQLRIGLILLSVLASAMLALLVVAIYQNGRANTAKLAAEAATRAEQQAKQRAEDALQSESRAKQQTEAALVTAQEQKQRAEKEEQHARQEAARAQALEEKERTARQLAQAQAEQARVEAARARAAEQLAQAQKENARKEAANARAAETKERAARVQRYRWHYSVAKEAARRQPRATRTPAGRYPERHDGA
jgi:colicin import membrane protein